MILSAVSGSRVLGSHWEKFIYFVGGSAHSLSSQIDAGTGSSLGEKRKEELHNRYERSYTRQDSLPNHKGKYIVAQ